MPEKISELLNALEEVRGKEYVEGLVDMANMLTAQRAGGEKNAEAES